MSVLRTELQTFLALCDVHPSLYSLNCKRIVREGSLDELVTLEEPQAEYYTSAAAFRADYLLSKLVSKSPNIPTQIDTQAVATAAFWTAEDRNRTVNERLYNRVDPILHRAALLIEKMLGELNARALEEISSAVALGPGSTYDVRGRFVQSQKLRKSISCTYSLIPFARSLIGITADEVKFDVVEGNRFTTVPKNSKTDRGICIEPTLNLLLQKGIGSYLRRRLKLFGCDLDDQGKNRSLAKMAYEKSLATIDLSMASDTLTESLVWRLLPPRWFELLDMARSPKTEIEGKFVNLEKFSSMGNGFTFELESLIFFAIVKSASRRQQWVSIYGDDIICHQKDSPHVVAALETSGFLVNRSKTHLGGCFFESCGGHFFKGEDVTPFYLRCNENIPYALQIANSLREYAWRSNPDFGCDPAFRPLWLDLVKRIPHRWRLPVPPEMGDTGLHVSESESELPHASTDVKGKYIGLEGRIVKHIVLTTKWKRISDFASLRTHLLRPTQFSFGREPVRGLFGKPKVRTTIKGWSRDYDWFDQS
jgi:hypothetical protein